MLNNWRMAQLHAQEAPDRVRELEEWGALFDRTKDGLILQRDFGGHRYARLAHVGDRTGLEMIRTLQQQHGRPRHRRLHGVHGHRGCCTDGERRSSGAFGYWRETGRFVAFRRRRWCWPPAGSARRCKVTSNSWEYTGDGHALALQAGADLIDMEFVQFHPTGMVWPPSVRGILVTEGVRGDGGVLQNSGGNRFMFDYIPDFFRKPRRPRPRTRPTAGTTDKKNNRRPPELLPRDEVARAINTEVKAGRGTAARRRLPRHRLAAATPEYIRKRLPVDVPPVQGAGRRRHHRRAPWRSGPTCHYVMGGVRGRPRHRGSRRPRAVRRRRGGRRHARRQPPRRQLAVGPAGLRPAGRPGRGRATPRAAPLGAGVDAAAVADAAADGARAVRARGRARTPTPSSTTCRRRCRSWSASSAPGRDGAGAGARSRSSRSARRRSAVDGHRQYNPGWHLATGPAVHAAGHRVHRRGPALERKESRGGHTRDDFPGPDPRAGRQRQRCVCTRDEPLRRRRGGARPSRPLPARCRAELAETASRRSRHGATTPTLRIWRGDADGGDLADYTVPVNEGVVVLDVIHRIQADPGRRPGRAAGTARPASAARAAPRSTAGRG